MNKIPAYITFFRGAYVLIFRRFDLSSIFYILPDFLEAHVYYSINTSVKIKNHANELTEQSAKMKRLESNVLLLVDM